MESTALSNIQKELLKVYAANIPDQQLNEIKELLSKYFAGKASDEFDQLWEQNSWDEQTMKDWANEHNRSESSH